MTEPLTIKLKTLTPLWTGGADGRSDRLHATGIIGSLRWWYEAIVRGLGGYACDPTQHACIYDLNKPNKNLCLGCQTFGATGWARRFRLIVSDSTRAEGQTQTLRATGNRLGRPAKDGRQQAPSWYFNNGQGRGGEFDLKVIPTDPNFDPMIIYGVLKLIEQHAGLAAKTQMGYGRIQVQPGNDFDPVQFVQKMQDIATQQPTSPETAELPAFTDMFFAQIKPQEQGLTATVNLKFDVRAAFRESFGNNQTLRHWVCGSVQGNNRQASKIQTGQAIDGVMAVWGWIPQQLPVINVTREQVIDEIKKTIAGYGSIVYWHEFNSNRDTLARHTDRTIFLNTLLQREEAQ